MVRSRIKVTGAHRRKSARAILYVTIFLCDNFYMKGACTNAEGLNFNLKITKSHKS